MSAEPEQEPAPPDAWSRLAPHGRVLLIRPSAVGDVIMLLPSLEALRRAHPGAHIGFLVEDRARDLIAGHPSLDRVHLFPRRRWSRQARNPLNWPRVLREIAAAFGEIRAQRYDLSVDFQGNLKGALLGLLSGAARRLGYSSVYARELNHWFTHERVAPGAGDFHRAEKFFSLVRRLGARDEDAAYRLPDAPESRQRVREFLASRRLTDYAVIHPGTSEFGRAKRWPLDRFAQVARRLGDLGLPAVVAWGPGEQSQAESIAAGGGSAIVALRTQSVLDLAELLRGAAVFVGCDSGPMHLCSAVGTPAVAIYGPHDPRVYGPFRHPRFRVVTPPGGSKRTGDVPAMVVIDAVEDLLRETGWPGGAVSPTG